VKSKTLLALLLMSLASCAYYNGMYNARRLAGDARKAERDGRAFEANRLWGLAATKAESLLAQHPRSKYVPEARLIQATSMERSGDCVSAAPVAASALAGSRETRVAEDAALLLGRCYEQLDDPAAALGAYDRLLGSADEDRRMEAAFRHGRALRELGRYDDALADLSGSQHPGARGERAAALMGAGRVTEGLAVVDTLLATRDSLAPWSDLLELYGQQDPVAASALTTRVARDSSFRRADRVTWVVADAERLAPLDPATATALLALAESLGGGSSSATRRAELTLVRAELAGVRTLPELGPMVDRLSDIRERGGPSALLAIRLIFSVQAVQSATDSALINRPQADLRFFLASEIARDSLRALTLAGGLLRDILVRWPESPYAPKAALALGFIGPEGGDSLRDGVLARQAASPYLLALRGEAAPGYRELEDSLRLFMAQYHAPPSKQRGVTRPGVKPTRDPRDDR
jgi:tetratricopeptide (TPR) repeat protein